jgi:hypothetical protein
MGWLILINKLIEILGNNATLGDAKTWIEVEENAQSLREEGHEDDPANA